MHEEISYLDGVISAAGVYKELHRKSQASPEPVEFEGIPSTVGTS